MLLACHAPRRETAAGLRPASLPAVVDEWALPPVDRRAEIGTAHQITVVATAGDGRWTVACQARVDTNDNGAIWSGRVTVHGDFGGDELVPYLFRGGGEGLAIDAFVAASPDDRWLAVVHGGKLVLVDDVTGRARALAGADLRADEWGTARVAAFDGDSEHFIYFRGTGATAKVVIRDLAQAREREIAGPPGLLWQVVPEPAGRWARIQYVPDDSNHNGKITWPTANTTGALGQRCDPPVRGRLTWLRGSDLVQGSNDRVRDAWLNLDTGALHTDRRLLGHVGDVEVVKTTDKSIRIGAMEVVPAECDAELVAVSQDPVRLVVICPTRSDLPPWHALEMFGSDFHVQLDARGDPDDELRQRVDQPYICVHRGCFHLEDGARIPLRSWSGIAYDTNILSSNEDGSLAITNTVTGHVTRLPPPDSYFAHHARAMVAVGTSLIDLVHERVIGHVERPPFAVDFTGRALVPDAVGGKPRDLPRGPLRWVAAHR